MTTERIEELVRGAYEGEVLGAELFRRLVDAETDPERARRLFAAQLLEEQTMDAAATLARDRGVAVSTDGAEQAAAAAAEALAQMAWPDRMRAVADATGRYRELYAGLEDALGSATHPSVAALRSHERALHAFAAGEVDGRGDADTALLAELDDDHRARLDAFSR